MLKGHPWVYASEVQKSLSTQYDGQVVECRDAKGRFLGSGIYNSSSQIIWRRLSYQKVKLDEQFIRQRIQQAIIWREDLHDIRRLIWSESDGLPGVVADQYGKVLVVQILTLAMEKKRDLLVKVFSEELKLDCILLRNDAPIRKHEGLDSYREVAYGKMPTPFWLKINDIDYWLDFEEGQKTGFYLDQRVQHQRIGKLAKGCNVLDAFCNQGSFALSCANNGAKKVTAVDISQVTLGLAEKNAQHQGLDITFIQDNVFDFFQKKKDAFWDLIILDPPSFTKNKARLNDALRGYKELNLRALQSLKTNGILATYSCSFHVDIQTFQEVVLKASVDAKREVKLLEYAHQPSDHPVLIGMPESEYLKGMILQVS